MQCFMGSPQYEQARRDAALGSEELVQLSALFPPDDNPDLYNAAAANNVFAVRDRVSCELAMEADATSRRPGLEALLHRLEQLCPKKYQFLDSAPAEAARPVLSAA